jgi:hypothetical protein
MPITLESQFRERPDSVAVVDELVGRYMPELIRVFGDRAQEAIAAILNVPGQPRLSEQGVSIEMMIDDIESSTFSVFGGTSSDCVYGDQFVQVYRTSHQQYPQDYAARLAYRRTEFTRLYLALPQERRQELVRAYIRTRNAYEWRATLGAIRTRLVQALSEPSRFVQGAESASAADKADVTTTGNPVRGALRDAVDDGQYISSVDVTARNVTGIPKQPKRRPTDGHGSVA